MKKTTKKITKRETHDCLSVKGAYATGGAFSFRIGRSGERLEWAGSDGPKGEEQLRRFVAFCKFRGDETNRMRIERIYNLAMLADSCAEFADLMERA